MDAGALVLVDVSGELTAESLLQPLNRGCPGNCVIATAGRNLARNCDTLPFQPAAGRDRWRVSHLRCLSTDPRIGCEICLRPGISR